MQNILDYFDLCERTLDDATLMTEVQEAALSLMADQRPLAFKAQIDWIIASLPFLLANKVHHVRVKNTVLEWRQLLVNTPELALASYGFLLFDPIEGLAVWRLNPEIVRLIEQLETYQSAGFALRLSVSALLERDMPPTLRAELEHLQSLL